jgi:hypothetical protein
MDEAPLPWNWAQERAEGKHGRFVLKLTCPEGQDLRLGSNSATPAEIREGKFSCEGRFEGKAGGPQQVTSYITAPAAGQVAQLAIGSSVNEHQDLETKVMKTWMLVLVKHVEYYSTTRAAERAPSQRREHPRRIPRRVQAAAENVAPREFAGGAVNANTDTVEGVAP